MKRLPAVTVFSMVAATGLTLFGLALGASQAAAADKLVILSAHRKSIQDEFLPRFKTFYKNTYKTDVEVEWLDQGGTSDDVRFLKAKFLSNPKTSGIDLFWGGGTAVFLDLNQDKLLQPYTLSPTLAKEVPAEAAGVPLFDKSKTWYASAMSSFGIFYNKKILKFDKLPEPAHWDDLALPAYQNQLSLADPRRSGTANTMNAIVLQSLGWDKGWELLTKIAGNTRSFTHSSSDPIKAVVAGDAAASMAIDFYASPKIADLGADNLGFILPQGQTVLDPDPIAIIKGAPNKQTAERFVEWVLSADAQQLLVLPKGAAGGPQFDEVDLGERDGGSSARPITEGRRTSPTNPFQKQAFLRLDLDKATRLQSIFNDLLGAMNVDTHTDLKAAWAAIIKRGLKPAEVAAFAKLPVNEAELLKMADKWDDNVFRNKTINEWVAFAKDKYKKLANQPS